MASKVNEVVREDEREGESPYEPFPGAITTSRLGRSLALPVLLLGFQLLHAAPTDVVINEILYHPDPDNTGGEFVELFNRGDTIVDLAGWALAEAVTFAFPAGTALDPGGYLVVARKPDEARTFYGVDGILGPFEGRLNNAGENLVLQDTRQQEIDAVPYDDQSPWPPDADGGGPSLELIDPSMDNSVGESWALGLSFSPGAVNAPAESGSGDVVITEILYKPLRQERRQKFDAANKGPYIEEGEDTFGEFVEVMNRSEEIVDLSGWTFSEGIEFRFAEGTVLDPGAYLVVAADPDMLMTRRGITNIVGPFSLSLRNTGERITLRDNDSQLVDTVRFNDQYPWPLAPDEDGQSLECVAPGEDNGTAANWRSSRGDPPPPPPLILANPDDDGWQFVSGVGSTADSRLVFFLRDAGEWLIDEVELRRFNGDENRIANGSFDAGDEGWSSGGNHEGTTWTGEGARVGAGAERLIATGPGDQSSGLAAAFTGFEGRVTVRVTAWVKHLSGSPTLRIRVVGSEDIDWSVGPTSSATALGPEQDSWTSPGLGQVTVSGGVYLVQHDRGDQAWELKLNDATLTSGLLIAGETAFNEENPLSFESGSDGPGAITARVAAEDTIRLVVEDSALVALDLRVAFRSGREPGPPLAGSIGLATPGRENSVHSALPPPFVQDLQHLPHQPTSQDEVTITARVTSIVPLASVELGVETIRARFRNTLDPMPMFDDGAHNDGAAGDGIYGAQVEARAQTLVHYWVRAEDGEGRVTSFPYDDDPSPAQAYFHFDRGVRTQLTTFHLFMSEGNLARLDEAPRSDEYLDGSLVIVDRRPGKESAPLVFPHLQVRHRGRGSRGNPRHQWKFKFNRHQLYDNNRIVDTQLTIPLTQRMAFSMFDLAGIDNLESDVVRLHLNGPLWEYYIAFESPNTTWAVKHGYGRGTESYKARSADTKPASEKNSDLFRNKLVTDLDYWGAYNKKARSLEPPDQIRELVETVNDFDDEDLLPWLDANVDLEQVMTHWGTKLLLMIDDFATHNYYIFRPQDGKWKMLAHDLDSIGRGIAGQLRITYGDGFRANIGWQRNKLFERIANNPTLRRIHILNMRRMLDTIFTDENIGPILAAEAERADSGVLGGDVAHLTRQFQIQRPNMRETLADENLPGPGEVPEIDPPGGMFSAPVSVTLSTPEGWQAVYTLDGSDPRLSRTALVYGGPFAVAQTSTVRAASIVEIDGEPGFASGNWTDLREAQFEVELGDVALFIRGDFSLDGRVSATDVVGLLFHLFKGADAACRLAGDANNDDALDISDAIFLTQYLYGRGTTLAAPFPSPGIDPDGNATLGCERGLGQ